LTDSDIKAKLRVVKYVCAGEPFRWSRPVPGFDDNLTSAARLGIVAALISGEAISFTDLKKKTGLADGNLHVQTRKLASAGYLEIIKGNRGKRSYTRFRITELGVSAMKLHVRKLQAILDRELGEIGPSTGPRPGDDSQVWS